jgi:hypothetical protein
MIWTVRINKGRGMVQNAMIDLCLELYLSPMVKLLIN